MEKNKYRIKLVHFAKGYYKIKYAYYRFIPIWHTIIEFETAIGGSWGDRLVDKDYNPRDEFPDIEAIRNYYKEQNIKIDKNKKDKAEKAKKQTPFNSKEF